MTLHQWQLLLLADFFICLFWRKEERKKGRFTILYVFIYVVRRILFLVWTAKLYVTFTSSVEFSSWLRLKWKWSVTTSCLTPYEHIRKPIYDWYSMQNAQGSNWRSAQAPWAVIIWMRKISKHHGNSTEVTPEMNLAFRMRFYTSHSHTATCFITSGDTFWKSLKINPRWGNLSPNEWNLADLQIQTEIH